MNKKTAMQQLLNQMKEERAKLQLPVEWDRCYQAIEMVMENTYIPLEKEQMIEFGQEVFRNRYNQIHQSLSNIADDIYNETYGGNK